MILPMRRRLPLFAGLIFIAGCSSASFEVAEGADTGGADDAIATDSGTPGDDSSALDSGALEEGVGETISTCAAVSNPTEIWVDAASTGAGATGTSDCPFRHIGDAIKYANTLPLTTPRTIKVRAGDYNEGAAIILRSGLTLSGAGVGLTKLLGGGPCAGTTTSFQCIVRVEGGAILEKVSIDAGSSGKHGVVTGATGSTPIVRYSSITKATGDGIAGVLVTAGAIVGPNIDSSGNRNGLVIWGSQTVAVLSNSKFDNNASAGISHEGTGVLTFTGGSVSNNVVGIRLGEPYTATPPANDIKDLTAKDNVEVGVKVSGVASARIRNSTITGSKIGVIAIHGASNYIDLGNAGSPGGNNFGGATSSKNTFAALCAMYTQSVPLNATGNTFPNCDTPQSLDSIGTSSGCDAITSYKDVWYRGATVPIMASCTKGP
jgi:hypothetical protein